MDKREQGKINRETGSKFELETRKKLESDHWIVIKNPNDVINGVFTKAKAKFNPYTKRVMMLSGGFPDFLCIRNRTFIGIECKLNGYLDPKERKKCDFLLKNNILDKIFIYSKKGSSEYEFKGFEEIPCLP